MKFLKHPVVRWIAFLPVSLLAWFVVLVVARFVSSPWIEPNPAHLGYVWAYFEALVQMFGAGAFIMTASWLAPRGKYTVSVVLATLAALVSVLGIIYSISRGQYPMVIAFAGGIGGLIYAAYLVKQSASEEEAPEEPGGMFAHIQARIDRENSKR